MGVYLTGMHLMGVGVYLVYLMSVHLMGVYVMGAYLIRLQGARLCARCTLVCEVHACICKMHVYEVYAAVGARLGDARLQGPACL